jgi:DNA-binding MarR family transcriptional regulator
VPRRRPHHDSPAAAQRHRPDPAGVLTPLEIDAWRGLLETHARLLRSLGDDLDEAVRLPIIDYDVLYQLAAAPGRRLRMMDLADAVLLTPSGTTRLIDRLERQGLVERQSEPGTRAVDAVLTAKGLAKFRAASQIHFAGVRRHFLEHLTAADLRSLADIWHRLLDVHEAAGESLRAAGGR